MIPEKKRGTCSVCGSPTVEEFVRVPQVPIFCNVLWPTRASALSAARGDITLGYCTSCGHVFNLDFDSSRLEYTQAYENSLHFSPRFQAYANDLAQRLIDSYGIRKKDVIDIGCGKGDFLAMLCARGENRGVGFDPSYVPENMDEESSRHMKIIREFYSPRHAEYTADLITCRHVLEHIPDPLEFVSNVRRSVGERYGCVVFFEVPNVMYTLRDLGIWDLIYEHYSYFSVHSLSHVFAVSGFTVRATTELYEGQFLGIDLMPVRISQTPAGGPKKDLTEMSDYVSRFAETHRTKVRQWEEQFREFSVSGSKVVVWGGGSKGVTFLNTTKHNDLIEFMVDINPRKQGMFVSGSGQRVVPPEFLTEYQPDIVIAMNPIYQDEIRETLRRLGVPAKLLLA